MQEYSTFDRLSEGVLKQLKDHKYKASTLTVYRRIFSRISKFMEQHGINAYSKEIGEQFLGRCKVSDSTIKAYKCAVRRLNDYLEDIPYTCHKTYGEVQVPNHFSALIEGYLAKCKNDGNKQYTINTKRKCCARFVKYIDSVGITDLVSLNSEQISCAISIFENKDDLARLRQFLRYLADTKVTKKDFSGIIPRYKRQLSIPTVYATEEISKMEDSIDTSTDTGKRNLAIIRLASRMGYRAGDITKLKWTEIDFSTGIVSIIQEKTGVPLTLSMPQDVVVALVSYMETLTSKSDDDYVFHAMSAPYGRISTSIIRHIINETISAAGIDLAGRKHGSHVFRSSLASSMVNDGISYATVQRLLGHTDPNVIKHYAKADIENLRKCAIDPPFPAGRFNDFLKGKEGD